MNINLVEYKEEIMLNLKNLNPEQLKAEMEWKAPHQIARSKGISCTREKIAESTTKPITCTPRA